MQHRITQPGPLLNQRGSLAQPGYATQPLLRYRREDIKASVWRIKEWDYYAALNHECGVALVIADLGYSAMISATVFDFVNQTYIKKTKLLWFVFGKLKLPSSSTEGDCIYKGKGYEFKFIRTPEERHLQARISRFDNDKDLVVDLVLQDLKDDSMVIATPWPNHPLAFYYNQKINCMPTSGTVRIGDQSHEFRAESSFSVLDWGRGVWTYKNTWYWASFSGIASGKRLGINLGYGFGDTSQASENMIFYDGVAHKLDQVTFEFDDTDFLQTWRFSDNEGRLKMEMKPIIDRQDTMNLGIIKNLGHQVFGLFSGYVILDNQKKISFDRVIGFAEQITNHY